MTQAKIQGLWDRSKRAKKNTASNADEAFAQAKARLVELADKQKAERAHMKKMLAEAMIELDQLEGRHITVGQYHQILATPCLYISVRTYHQGKNV